MLKIYIFVYLNPKTFRDMKRFSLLLVAMLITGVSFAQQTDRDLVDVQIAYDEAVLSYKRAIVDMRNEERRVVEATERHLDEVKSDLVTTKRNYKAVVAEQKQRVAAAKSELKSAIVNYKAEVRRAKQEVAAAKANRKSVIAERKSDVARAKANIARVKADTAK